jgi:hypothetical protein
MGRIVVTEFVSLDGVMEDPGGSEDFKYGGWTFEITRGDEGDKFKLDETMASEALLLGRVTYEGFAKAWPTRDGEFADKFNTMPKYVVSSTLEDQVEQHHGLKGDVVDDIQLKQIDGSSRRRGLRLVQALLGTIWSTRSTDGVPGDPRNRAAPVRCDDRKTTGGSPSEAGRADGVLVAMYERAGR